MDRQREVDHLALADRHIAEGEARIALQRALIAHLKRREVSTEAAEDLLRILCETLVQFRQHREMIIAAIGDVHGETLEASAHDRPASSSSS